MSDHSGDPLGVKTNATSECNGRRPYATPTLKVYGPFEALTARVGFRSATSDGGFLTFIKTK